MKAILIKILLILCFINPTFAAEVRTEPVLGKEGHGGYGVLIQEGNKENVYILDFLENGLVGGRRKPFFNKSLEVSEQMYKSLELISKDLNLSSDEEYLLALKLTEIENISPTLAYSFIAGIKLYSWVLINFDLNYTPDFSTVIRIDDRQLVQLANRKGTNVRINEKLWNRLDAANKVGLIFHEILYAFVADDAQIRASGNDPRSLVALSAKARDLTGYLFFENLKIKGIGGFQVKNDGSIAFNFTDDCVDIFNHNLVEIPNNAGFGRSHALVLKKGELNVHMETFPHETPLILNLRIYQNSQQCSSRSNSFFSSKFDNQYYEVENKIENYCSELQVNRRYNLKIMLKTFKLNEVYVMFDKGHLSIVERQPLPEERIIYREDLITKPCKEVLMKEIYLRNRFYTPLMSLPNGI